MEMTIQGAMDLAVQYHQEGKLKEAEALYRQVLTFDPYQTDAMHLLGLLASHVGKNTVAIQLIQQAIKLSHPNTPSLFWINLSGIYLGLTLVLDAENAARQGLTNDPTCSGLWNNLGNALYIQGKILESADAFKRAIEHDSLNAGALSNWANIMQETGHITDAMAAHKQACTIDPNHKAAADNYLRDVGFLKDLDPIFVRDEHIAWAREFEKSIHPESIFRHHTNKPDAAKRIKAGLISPDFRLHSVTYFIEPLLRNMDRTKFEIFCYANVVNPDETTKRLQTYDVNWRNIIPLDDQKAAQMIIDDGIDILIDLAGHTSENRCRILALRAAPLQMTYLGYPFSTGLKECDYRITDALSDPVGMTESHYSEKLLRLPTSTWCFHPPSYNIAVGPSPALKNGYITFGSFNTYNKINDHVLDTWSKILHRVAHSRLLIKAHGFSDKQVHDQLLSQLQSRGIAPSRVKIMGREHETSKHLQLYHEMDIALDPFPYNGTTTTCEAIWQGLPVITLEGATHVSRVGFVINTLLGREELIAKNPDQYVDIAEKLASDVQRLDEMRQSSRSAMMQSKLYDQMDFTRNFEQILTQAWQEWCEMHQ